MSRSMYRPTPIALPVSPAQSRVKVRAGDKWLLMGTSGSGKTTGLKYLDSVYTRLFPTARHYLLDSKLDGDFDSFPGLVKNDLCPQKPGRNARYQTWQVVQIIPEQIEKWLWGIRHDAPAVVEIDELYTLCYKKNQYSTEYNILQKVGRSLPVGSITNTQELSQIPANAYKQATHRLGFYLDGEYDRRIRNAMLKHKVEDPRDQYGFYYQHVNGRGEPGYFSSIQEFLGL
jgi:energy-coupling factor transporter ATP-binding protein EcfA2